MPQTLQCLLTLLMIISLDATKLLQVDIVSKIRTRFAITVIQFRVENPKATSEEAKIDVILPPTAYITNFTYVSGNKITVAHVEEKREAADTYIETVLTGEPAAMLEHTSFNSFAARVTLTSFQAATIKVSYQQVLERVNGVYRHEVFVTKNMTRAEKISMEYEVKERGRLTQKHIPKYGTDLTKLSNAELLELQKEKSVQLESIVDSKLRASTEMVRFEPTEEGQLILLYDVQRDTNGNQIETVDGYFVHLFAPSDLSAGNRHVIFVLDISGSMRGSKYRQVKDAMAIMLRDLGPSDLFNVFTFNTIVQSKWLKSEPATLENIENTINFLEDSQTEGYTNLYDALIISIDHLHKAKADPMLSMLFVLTDGRPSVEVTYDQEILRKVELYNPKKYSIHTVAFGVWAKYDLLRNISDQNRGIARKLNHLSNAAVQLEGFFRAIARPVMRDVSISYVPASLNVDKLVSQNGNLEKTGYLMEGMEIIMAGKFTNPSDFEAVVTGKTAQSNSVRSSILVVNDDDPSFLLDGELFVGHNEPILLPYSVGGAIERMWAHMSIQNLMDDIYAGFDAQRAKATVIYLSQQYNLVTPLTSLVLQPGSPITVENGDLYKQPDLLEASGETEGSNVLQGLSLEELLKLPQQSGKTDKLLTKSSNFVENVQLIHDATTVDHTPSAYNYRKNRCSKQNLDLLFLIDTSGSPGSAYQSRELCRRVLYWTTLNRRLLSRRDSKTRVALAALDKMGYGVILHQFNDNQNANFVQKIIQNTRSKHVPNTKTRDLFLLSNNAFRKSKRNKSRKVIFLCGFGDISKQMGPIARAGRMLRSQGREIFAALPDTNRTGRVRKMKKLTGDAKNIVTKLEPHVERSIADKIC